METKKTNIFIIFMVMIMCAFSIFIGVSNRGEDGKDGQNGMSAYELAIKNGIITSNMSEYDFIKSLYGKDGSNVTLEDVYKEYLKATNKDISYTEFILEFYPDKIVSDQEAVSMVENTTQSALRSTVDICYSYYMDTPIIYGSYSGDKFYIDKSSSESYVSIGVSAGSGVIYDYEDTDNDGEDDVAYIITNYHVVYCSNYSSDSNYYVYYDETSGKYFTANYNESMVKSYTQGSFFGTQTYYYINSAEITNAPIYTHFLDEYEIYLYGYQSSQYAVSASFIGGSANNDIAVLKVEKNKPNTNNALIFSDNYKAADIGDSSSLDEGETIVAVGNPLLADTSNVDNSAGVSDYVESAKEAYIQALCLTSTSGEVSNLSEYCVFESLIDANTVTMRLIRVSSAINAGNSGGGLYGTDGKLVGIVNGKIESSSYDNIGYAIPINVAKRIADQIIAQCENDNTKTRINVLTTESIGLDVYNQSSNSYYDKNTLTWVLSNDVAIESVSKIAETAGLKVDDIIKSITISGVEYKVHNDYDVNDILLNTKTDESSIIFNVLRIVDGIETDVSITLSYASTNLVEIK